MDLTAEARGNAEAAAMPILAHVGEVVEPRDVNNCRSCGAMIWWRVNPSGARQPFDYDVANRMGTTMPHHATCPQGREWRRRRAATVPVADDA